MKLYTRVVLYQRSTSNHNFLVPHLHLLQLYYIKDLHQTTTNMTFGIHFYKLYYIKDLHQTTTSEKRGVARQGLYYIKDLHQTTTPR